jgi:hypothetical protein
LQRALIADLGYPANLAQDAIYPVAKVDNDNKALSGKNKYFVHFGKGQLPPANGFWSITLYDPDWFFVANPLNRFTVSMRDQPVFNSDGSLDFYFQNESPGGIRKRTGCRRPREISS